MLMSQPDDRLEFVDVEAYSFARVTWVAATPAAVYDLISDVSRIAAWSPNADDVAYDDGAGAWVGAWFSGRNRKAEATWTTRSQVSHAEPGSAFGFVVGGLENGIVGWLWTFSPSGTGCEVRQEWRLLRTDPVLGSSRADLDNLRDYMADSVENTLVALARWTAVRRARRHRTRPRSACTRC
jgi:hypothetical protein